MHSARYHRGLIDIALSLLFILTIGSFISILLPERFIVDYLLTHTINFVLIASVILYLMQKYQFDLFEGSRCGSVISIHTVAGILICSIVNFPVGILIGNSHLPPKEITAFASYNLVSKIYMIMLICIIGPVLEELFFRGYVFNILKKKYNIIIGAIASSLLYMFFHDLKINFMYLFIPGLIYVYVYDKTKNILSSITVHSMNNTIWFLLTYLGINYK